MISWFTFSSLKSNVYEVSFCVQVVPDMIHQSSPTFPKKLCCCSLNPEQLHPWPPMRLLTVLWFLWHEAMSAKILFARNILFCVMLYEKLFFKANDRHTITCIALTTPPPLCNIPKYICMGHIYLWNKSSRVPHLPPLYSIEWFINIYYTFSYSDFNFFKTPIALGTGTPWFQWEFFLMDWRTGPWRFLLFNFLSGQFCISITLHTVVKYKNQHTKVIKLYLELSGFWVIP